MDMIHYYESPAGLLALTAEGEFLTGLRFDSRDRAPGAAETDRLPVFREADRWLDIYFSGRDPGFIPPILPRGTAFRRAVWEMLLMVPYGKTVTYGEIAARMAARMNVPRMSAQAVGGAAGANPIALIIPCHRVVGADGGMTGYAGGVDRKIRLLQMERVNLPG